MKVGHLWSHDERTYRTLEEGLELRGGIIWQVRRSLCRDEEKLMIGEVLLRLVCEALGAYFLACTILLYTGIALDGMIAYFSC